MTIKEQIDQDLKTAMLGGDKAVVSTLRGVKSAILYEEVAKGSREEGLPEAEVLAVLAKEAKKRQESADLFLQGGGADRAEAELAEKATIEKYLPAQISDEQLHEIIEQAAKQAGATDMKQMGLVIAAVKERVGSTADGGRIAAVVRERLSA